MSKDFQLIDFLNTLSKSGSSGILHIIGDSVTWELHLVKGKLKYAIHSLQSWETIKYYLLRLGYVDASKTNPTVITQDISSKSPIVKQLINILVEQKDLDPSQESLLMRKLTEDALESLLCLSKGKAAWLSKGGVEASTDFLLELPLLVDSLYNNLQKWQKLSPLITSPHQRPYCVNPALIEQPSAYGNLSPATLKQLVNLMRGMSIRELGLFLKQDDLKVALLLFPYIKEKIFQLHPPKSPLDKLPPIPSSFQPTQTITPFNPAQKKYKIVCIDDSPVMLDILQNYLAEKYQLFTIENPMKSLSSLFEIKPDLVLMDISMPGINGNRLCQILKSSSVFNQVPIILVSGNTKILNQENTRAVGATDFLAKPFSQESLENMINKYLK